MTTVQIGQPEPAAEPPPRQSLLNRRVTPGMVLLVILALAAFRLWVVETAIVEGRSMDKTLLPGDHVLVVKVLGLKRFDVVVLTDPQARETVIKRVVGLPGDIISMVPRVTPVNGREVVGGTQLYIDGDPYEEPYATSSLPTVVQPRKIRPGRYFVLGDNRDDSVDSRTYGGVDRELIHGVAVLIFWPIARMHFIPRTAELVAARASAAPDG